MARWGVQVLSKRVYFTSWCIPQAQQSKWVGYQGSLDYLGADFTASATLANPDPLSSSCVAVLQFLQALTPRYSLCNFVIYPHQI